MDITEDYVSFEVAKLLKEKGFEQDPDYATSWYANQYYKNSCQGEWFEGEHQIIEDIDDKCNISYLSECGIFIPAPTLQMAMKWLREVHKIDIDITSRWNLTPEYHICEYRYRLHYSNAPTHDINQKFNTYEQACEAAIKYCLENLI